MREIRSPIDYVLERLAVYGLRSCGANRWRARCPACRSTNRSTLSIGEGDNGAVLVRCFAQGCGPDAIAQALGIELSDLFPPRDAHAPPLKRRRLLSAAQALELLTRDATVVVLASAQLRQGLPLADADHRALLRAAAHFGELIEETRS
jgi:hypothetical protein